MDKHDALEALRRGPEREPQKRSGRWRIVALAAAVLLGLAAAGAWWFTQQRGVPVQTAIVTVEGGGRPGSVLSASGYVVAQVQATVAAQVTGMITEVLVREGEKVEKDQVIARLDDRAARAAAAAAAGQLEAGEGAVAQYKALVDRYRRDLARKQALFADGAVSQATLDEAVANLKQNQALVAYQSGLVEQYRRTLDYDNTLLAYTEIRAPFAGVVTERYAHPGEMISPQAVGGFTQTGICTIVDMSSLEVDVDVSETLITRLHPGQAASVTLDAYPDWRLPAHVIIIVPTANQQKATVKVRIGFDRLDPRILPEMSAQVSFEADAAPIPAGPAQMFVPAAAVHADSGGHYVWRMEEGRVRRIDVRVAARRGESVRVLAGLQDGDRIVTSAGAPLADGQKVRE